MLSLCDQATPQGVTRSTAAATVVAVAAGDQDNGKDDQPYPVVVKEIAQAVVHDSFLLIKFGRERADDFTVCPSVIILCRRNKKVHVFCRTVWSFCVAGRCAFFGCAVCVRL